MEKKILIDYGIKNKRALIVGGTKGLGKEISLHLLKSGCKIFILGRDSDALSKSLNYFRKLRLNKPEGFTADISSEASTNKLIEKFKQRKINFDIIVHNAGGSVGVRDIIASREDFKKVWNLNLGAGIALNQFVVPYMKKKKWGRIVHVSSASAINYSGYTAYVAAKSAVNGYVKSISRTLSKDGIIVSAVCPGTINHKGRYLTTQQEKNTKKWKEYVRNNLPIERLAAKNEIASVILFLCSKLSSYCSGSIFSIDGSQY